MYNHPVPIEPPFQAFTSPNYSAQASKKVDDGRVPSLWQNIKGLFSPPKVSDSFEIEEISSIPAISYTPTFERFVFRVNLPKKYEAPLEEMERFLYMIGYSYHHFSFEIVAINETITLQWTCDGKDRERFISQFRAYFPTLGIEEVEDAVRKSSAEAIAIIDFGMSEEFMLPLASVKKLSPDPLTGIFGILERLRENELVVLQVIFQGCRGHWTHEIMSSVTTAGGDSFFEDVPTMPKYALEKVSSPLYGVVLRVTVATDTNPRTSEVAINMLQSIIATSKSNENQLMPLSNEGYPLDDHVNCVLGRESYRPGMLMNVKELLNWVHIPDSSLHSYQITRSSIKTKPVPKEFRAGTYPLGTNVHLGDELPVYISDEHRLRHTHVIGTTGSGKSNLLLNLIVQDILSGVGCAVIDPHGDLIDKIMKFIPEERAENIVLVDPSDMDYPIGFNILQAQTEAEKVMLSSDLVALFKEHATSWGDQMTGVLANTVNAFLESSEGGTLADLRRFLVEKDFRDNFLKTVTDPHVLYYWQKEYPLMKSYSLMPLLTRLDTFLRPKVIRNMLSQKDGLDFKEILNSGKTLLIKLPQGLIGEENSYLLGTLFVAKLYQAALGRQSMRPGDRLPYYLYLDEFQHFMTPSLKGILSGTRKYGLGLVLAHQDLSQLFTKDHELGSSILSNPAVRVSFRVGDIDAKKLEEGFGYFEANDLQSLAIGEAVVRIGGKDKDFNLEVPLMPEVDDGIADSRTNAIIEIARSRYAKRLDKVEPVTETIPSVSEEPTIYEAIEEKVIEEPFTKEVLLSEDKLKSGAEEFVERESKKKEESLHRVLQNQVKQLGEGFGYKATIEEQLVDGGRVDVGLLKNNVRIACEVSVTNTSKYETGNVQKCLDAGYALIFVLSDSKKHLDEIEGMVKASISSTELDKVRFGSYQDLVMLFEEIAAKEASSVKRVKGYRVKVNYKTSNETKSKQDTLTNIILDSLKRKDQT